MSSTHSGSNQSSGRIAIRSPTSRRAKQQTDFQFEQFLDEISFYDLIEIKNQHELLEKLEHIKPRDLLKAVGFVKAKVAGLKLDTYVMIEFLKRNDPRLLLGIENRRGSITSTTVTVTRRATTVARRSFAASGVYSMRSIASTTSRVSALEERRRAHELHLNYSAKVTMIQTCINNVEKRLTEFEINSLEHMKKLRIEIEELKYTSEEADKTARCFELHFLRNTRDLSFLQTAKDDELMQRLHTFVENWLKSGHALISALRLSMTPIKTECIVYRKKLSIKKDLKGILTAIDFHQLFLKREELTAELEEKISNVAGLKNKSGRSAMILAEMKAYLIELENEGIAMSNYIERLKATNKKLASEDAMVRRENRHISNHLKMIRNELEHFEAPSVAQYAEEKQRVMALEKEKKVWLRKLRLLKITYENAAKRYKARALIWKSEKKKIAESVTAKP